MRVVFPKRVCVCVLAIVAGLETQNLFTIFHAIVFVLNFISFVFAVRAFFTNIVIYLVHFQSLPTRHMAGQQRALTRPSCVVCIVQRTRRTYRAIPRKVMKQEMYPAWSRIPFSVKFEFFPLWCVSLSLHLSSPIMYVLN